MWSSNRIYTERMSRMDPLHELKVAHAEYLGALENNFTAALQRLKVEFEHVRAHGSIPEADLFQLLLFPCFTSLRGPDGVVADYFVGNRNGAERAFRAARFFRELPFASLNIEALRWCRNLLRCKVAPEQDGATHHLVTLAKAEVQWMLERQLRIIEASAEALGSTVHNTDFDFLKRNGNL